MLKNKVNYYLKASALLSICMILLLDLGCSKSSDPGASAGCNFTFKGKTFTSSIAVCDNKQLNGTNGTWILAIRPDGKEVGFDDGSATGYSYANANATSTTVTKSGNTVT